ncbi:MAG: OprO/OprP family phosphate-selective porin [Tannerellaceae bacterium]|nr:OprO/OprP family phosphate-selective porin [Tannerellaceae bacterium]
MKKMIFILSLVGGCVVASAQTAGIQDEKSLLEEFTQVKKKSDKFNLSLDTHGSFDMNFRDGFENGAFRMRELRLEARGQLNDWLSYRYRQRLNRPNTGGDKVDNLPASIDVAGIGIKLSDKFSLFAGKQCAAYGGIEFDLNPIGIYEYSDILEYMSNFMTGMNVTYTPFPQHEFQLQILNSLISSTQDTYGTSPAIRAAKLPLVYTLNWNGNFNENYLTRWSVSAMNQAQGKWMYYYALGNQLNLGRFGMFLDFMYSNEDIDRKGIITSLIPSERIGEDRKAFDAGYRAVVSKLNYCFQPQWNVFVQGMYETASVTKAGGDIEKGKYRTSYGYLAGLEYYPVKNSNLHFFLTYVGRSYDFTGKGKEPGHTNYNTHRISVGFIYKLPLF